MENFFKTQWQKYKARKTKAGIVIDFLFLALFVAVLNPVTGPSIKAFFVKQTMRSVSESDERIKLSDKDYEWRYLDLEGKPKSFSDLKGKVVFLNLWATWCPPCVAEFGDIDELYKSYKDKVEFVLISSDEVSKIMAFLDKKGYAISSNIYVEQLPSVFQSKTIPATFIISKNGELVVKKKGAAKWNGEKSRALLDKLIAE